MNEHGNPLLKRDGVRTVLASLISIVIGLAVGSVLVVVVGLFSPNLGLSSAWEGIRLIFLGLVSTGRNSGGSLTWDGHAGHCPGDSLLRTA